MWGPARSAPNAPTPRPVTGRAGWLARGSPRQSPITALLMSSTWLSFFNFNRLPPLGPPASPIFLKHLISKVEESLSPYQLVSCRVGGILPCAD